MRSSSFRPSYMILRPPPTKIRWSKDPVKVQKRNTAAPRGRAVRRGPVFSNGSDGSELRLRPA